MSDKNTYLTKEKHEEMEKELNLLKTDKRKEIAENLEYAKSLGDLSENAEYHEARAQQAELEDKISKLEAVLRSATIVSDKHTGKINVGSKVTLEKAGTKEKIVYSIVGSEEADIASRKISPNSPLGAAIVGRKKGEEITIATPRGKNTYTILAVE